MAANIRKWVDKKPSKLQSLKPSEDNGSGALMLIYQSECVKLGGFMKRGNSGNMFAMLLCTPVCFCPTS